jgi:hypothetical protein
MEIQMLYSELTSKRACIHKSPKIDPSSTAVMSRISLISKLSKQFSKQCPMMELDRKCSSRSRSLELRTSLRGGLLPYGKCATPSSSKTLPLTFVISISMLRLRRMSIRLKSSIQTICLFIRLLSNGDQIFKIKLIPSRLSLKNQALPSILNI